MKKAVRRMSFSTSELPLTLRERRVSFISAAIEGGLRHTLDRSIGPWEVLNLLPSQRRVRRSAVSHVQERGATPATGSRQVQAG